MNLLNFNRQIGKAVASSPLVREYIADAMESPVLEWRGDVQEGKVLDTSFVFHPGTRIPRFPFDAFRIQGGWRGKKGEGNYHTSFKAWVVAKKQPGKPSYSLVLQVDLFECNGKNMMPPDSRIWHFVVSHMERGIGISGQRWMGDRWVEEVRTDLMSILSEHWLIWMAIDFQNPHFYLARKCPPLPPRQTVEWQRAREHYVLLHKSHAANRKELAGKQIVIDSDTVHRMAHCRRGFFRVLKHPRYGANVGKRVWVRPTWVGPKEWTDRSGQIYRIVDDMNNLN